MFFFYLFFQNIFLQLCILLRITSTKKKKKNVKKCKKKDKFKIFQKKKD